MDNNKKNGTVWLGSKIHRLNKGDKVTIIKSFFYNGEGWFKTVEFGEVPDIFIEVSNV
jgi:hypothetical protein